MVSNREMTIHFLSSQRITIISKWKDELMHLPDGYIGYFKGEVENIFNLLMDQLGKSDTDIENVLKVIGKKIAYDRVTKQLNMEIFFSSVTIGRSLIIEHVLNSKVPKEEISDLIKQINIYFDQLIQFALSHYTELKTQELDERYKFISPNHKDRLTLLGQMTSSFVHEFRNPLTSIMGFIQLLQAEQSEIKYLDIISKELDQLNYRITQFLNMSKKETSESPFELFSISQLVNEVIEFLYPSILEVNAAITCNVADDAVITGSEEEFRQVLLNIILNALDVVAGMPSPSIYISGSESPPGILTLNISNNGPKIPKEVLPNIFEPFITTKKRGTGLGLFVCKEIVLKHKGTLSCHSTDFLTTFSIQLQTK
ncbi:GHKL domain-containing protein [Peribacillus muralis]|uniref:histidine kinase N-terminal domain-containing protein n=1 Tax=Peribacillus muralis TaxID=264697 RepID=UPI001F4ED76C|nr:histidine kinase N-terminal domain-containing protein [Peribacillus muralis]MCK1993032.1 ATP-binding protein [Peribacillus muralis]MCK2013587.1 ATP-binding protein [Peribacillus muralis]